MRSKVVPRKQRSADRGFRPSALISSLAGLFFAASSAATLGIAQTSAPRRTIWDGAYTEAQATRGIVVFDQSCAGCHSLAAEGKSPLVGEPFWKSFSQKSVGDLLEYVSANMPNGNPGSLNGAAYRDLVALMLKSNGFPAGAMELEPDAIAQVKIVPKDGSTALPANALARVVGCLARSGSDWAVTSATNPERAERAVSSEEDATRPLGSRTMPLKFVLTKLDSFAGSRVVVNGILIGPDGEEGINVTTVNRVAERCPSPSRGKPANTPARR